MIAQSISTNETGRSGVERPESQFVFASTSLAGTAIIIAETFLNVNGVNITVLLDRLLTRNPERQYNDILPTF